MKFTLLFSLALALVAAAQDPVCECCGPEGPKPMRMFHQDNCYSEATKCSSLVKSYESGATVDVRCASGTYYLTTDKCFVPAMSMGAGAPMVIRPCKADEGCLSGEGPMSAQVQRRATCLAEPYSGAQVRRTYAAGTDIKIWCKGGSTYFLTTDKCWVPAGKVPGKSSTVPICGNWRPA